MNITDLCIFYPSFFGTDIQTNNRTWGKKQDIFALKKLISYKFFKKLVQQFHNQLSSQIVYAYQF